MGTRNVPVSSCLFATTTTGTGTYAVGSAVTGYFVPADVSPSLAGLRVGYVAVDSLTAPTIREEGEGVLTSGTPWTLTRATIRRTLSGGVAGSSAINWSAGTKYIFLTPLPAQIALLDTDGWLHVAGDLVLATNGAERARVSSSGAWTFADAVAARSGLGVPPTPTASSGVGQFTALQSTAGAALALPSGGTWAFWIVGIEDSTRIWASGSGTRTAGINAGGSTIGTATAGIVWFAVAWRIA